MMYFRVANNKIVSGPIELPTTWTDKMSGETYVLNTLSPTELIKLGWLEMIPDTTNNLRIPYDTIESQTYIINGNVVNETTTLFPLTIQDVIVQKSRIISEFQDTWMNGIFEWNGRTWFGDEQSRQNITGITSAIANGVPIPPGFTWTDSNITPVVMSATDLVTMGAAMLTWVNTCYQTKYFHIGNISVMTNDDLIISYDHTIGWPL